MNLLLLSTALAGLAVTIQATRGAVSAGPVMAPEWGTPTALSGGTVTITMDRSKYRCAPDSVGFTVDLSGSDFDTPAPGSGTSYDRRFHELEYYWTFGDPGTWTAPVKTLGAHKNRNFAYGAFARHMYRAAGIYPVTLMVVEPSSGKVATAQTTVEVVHPDTVFPSTMTICVNPVGDTDFSAKPPGAQQFNAAQLVTDDAIVTAAATASANAEKVRILFKSGWTGIVSANIASLRSVSFGVYGGSSRAKWLLDRARFSNQGNGDNVIGCLWRGGNPWGDFADFRCAKIDFQGDFNEETDLVYGRAGTTAFRGLSAHRYMFHDCRFDGWQGSTFSVEAQQTTEREGSDAHLVHLDDCTISNFGGQYPLYGGGAVAQAGAGSWWVYTGIRIARSPDALTEFAEGQRALTRQYGSDYIHARGCDMYHSDGDQPVFKLADGDPDGTTRINIHTNYLESTGLSVLDIAFTGAGRPAPYTNKAILLNALFDSNIMVGGWRSKHLVEAFAAGMTWRNNMMVVPPGPTVITDVIALFMIQNRGNVAAFPNWPTRIYNNTLVSLRNTADTDTAAGGLWLVRAMDATSDVALSSLGITFANNVVHQPNLDTPDTAFAPLSTDTLLTAYCAGFRPTYHPIVTVLASVVPTGGSYSVHYGGAAAYLAVSSPKHTLTQYGGAAPSFSLTFGATTVTVTNTGSAWPAGATMELKLYSSPGNYRPKDPAYASGNVLAFAPLTGSAALGAALSEPSSERSILGQVRPNYPSMGAWEMP